MSYFGIIKKEEIDGFSIEEIDNYLAENNCYDTRFSNKILENIINSISFNNNVFQSLQDEIEFKPKIDLVKEFYFFIFNIYKKKVFSHKYKFFLELEENFYGFEEFKKRKIALSHFNDIFEKLDIEIINIIGEIKSEDGIIQTEIYSSKIFKLYMYQLQFKQSICSTKNLINYLIGNQEFYTEKFYEENNEIKNTVYFGLIANLMGRKYMESDIDGFIYFTLNQVSIIPNSELDWHLWVPSYRDESDEVFGDFVNKLGFKFQNDFYIMKTGIKPSEKIITDNFEKGMNTIKSMKHIPKSIIFKKK